MGCVLGLDTSNYTTSAAWFDGETGENAGKLLEVPQGSLGLRQSEALFQHVKRLPEIVEHLKALHLPSPLSAVGASTRPREVEGSYMPCFLAGESQARVLATTMAIPFYPCSHQQGHIAAAAWADGPAGPAPPGVAPVGRDHRTPPRGARRGVGQSHLHRRDHGHLRRPAH